MTAQKVSRYVPAPFQGISQASPQALLNEQAVAMSNLLVEIPEGGRQRPPLTWLWKMLSTGASTTARAHIVIDPDDGSPLILVVNREGAATVPRLYDLAGNAKSITIASAAQTYINNVTNPKTQLRLSTAVDYTFFTANNVTVSLDATPYATRPYEGIFFIKASGYGKTFKATITKTGGTPRVATFAAPNGTKAGSAKWVGTDKVAQTLVDQTAAAAAGDPQVDGLTFAQWVTADLTLDGITVAHHGAFVYVSSPSTDFTMEIEDDAGGTNAVVVKDSVNKFEDLPRYAVDGFTVKVAPANSEKTGTGAYWVTFSGNPSKGTWKETYAPGGAKGFDTSKMPVGLIKQSGVWHLDVVAWKQRLVGDATTAADPGFVGNTIQDIAYESGRLLILSSEELFACAADDPFRCYPATMTTTIDSDPFSLSPPGEGRALFRAITTFKERVVVTGRHKQAILRFPGDGSVTVTTVKFDSLSDLEIADDLPLRPLGSNGKVYIPVPLGGSYKTLYEVATDRVSGEVFPDDLMVANPQLLPSGTDCRGHVEPRYLAVYGSSAGTSLIAHLYRYYQNQRVQNAFFPNWNLPTGWTLVDLLAYGSIIYLLMQTSAELHVFSMDMSPKAVDPVSGATIATLLDGRVGTALLTSAVYSATTGNTTITSPIAHTLALVTAAGTAGPWPEGYSAEIVGRPSSTVTVVAGDWSAQSLYVGDAYTYSWTPNEIRLFGADSRVMHGKSLRVDSMKFDVSRCAGLQCRVQIGTRSDRTKTLPVDLLNTPPLYTGPWKVNVGGQAKDTTLTISSASHLPAPLVGFEWQGLFTPTAQRG